MLVPIITEGATTDHGGVVVEGIGMFKIDGKKVHVEGMTHFCPKCDKEVFAIATNHTKKVNGKAFILEGDKASCGAKFIANQGMAFVGGGETINQQNKSNLDSNILNNEDHEYGNKFQILDKLTQKPLAYANYKLVYDGKEVIGVTDEEGYTKFISSPHALEVEVFLISGKKDK